MNRNKFLLFAGLAMVSLFILGMNVRRQTILEINNKKEEETL